MEAPGSGLLAQEVRRNIRLSLVFLPTLLSLSSRFLRALQVFSQNLVSVTKQPTSVL